MIHSLNTIKIQQYVEEINDHLINQFILNKWYTKSLSRIKHYSILIIQLLNE